MRIVLLAERRMRMRVRPRCTEMVSYMLLLGSTIYAVKNSLAMSA